MSESTAPETDSASETASEVVETGPTETDWKALARKWEGRAKASKAEADANRDAAKRLAELEEASKTAEQKQAEAFAKMKAELDAYKQAEQRAAWITEVAAEVKLPEGFHSALRGDTREDILAHAEQLKALTEPKGTPVPDVGKTPEIKTTAARQAVRELFKN